MSLPNFPHDPPPIDGQLYTVPGGGQYIYSETENTWLIYTQTPEIPPPPPLGDIDASQVISGVFDPARIPNLDASKITSGTFDSDRIPDLDASKITTGTIDEARLPELPQPYLYRHFIF